MTQARPRRRTRQEQAEASSIPEIFVGEIDSMSRLAAMAHVPLCGKSRHLSGELRCTRAAGHHEGDNTRSHAHQHVAATGDGFIAVEVW